MDTKIYVVNHSQIPLNLNTILPDLQTQLNSHLAPAWKLGTFELILSNSFSNDGWGLLLVDHPDQANALGYHDDSLPNSLPLGKVFVGLTVHYNLNPTVTMSHELGEMAVDPYINKLLRYGQRRFAVEPFDPCESDQYGYLINTTLVSDFVLPSYYTGRSVGMYRDYMKHINQPRLLLPGGYYSWLDNKNQWHQSSTARRPGTSQRTNRRQLAIRS